MLNKLVMAALVAQAFSGLAMARGEGAVEDLNIPGQPPMLGLHWERGQATAHQARPGTSPLMTYQGGKIMPTAVTQAIFWGTSWSNSSFIGDKISGIDDWYTGFSNANYAKTSDEYTGTNGRVGAATSYLGHIIDTSAASGGGSTSAILAEVCKVIKNPDPSGNGYYAVYTDRPRGNAGYCAYHSYGQCGGTPVQFAFFWSLDGDPGCDPQDTSGLHSQGLAALANVSGHELSEARTDPASPGGWYDRNGQENGDKCAWTFGAPLVTFSNGVQWKIQGEWSNAAYTAGTGYPNSSGQKGCLSGL
ncbi:hypothetical protein [Ralstonia soli]|uniref:Uncharacterized protein n=1 Tax=Ralstonia soli TaxID=2953896 RepID=A0ABT1AGA6_9RALS|nr:hypothetical protein [Ralstonia soli]MCO5397386.1 hypothetical protein [Ralstonia soli]